MSVSKKAQKRIIFWSVFLGAIVIGLIILFVIANNFINATNSKIADSIFYGDHGGVEVDDNSLVLENEQLRAANSQLEVITTPKDVSQDQPEEYCMPKEHVKRVAKALSFNDKDIECQNVCLDVAQYNLSAECYVYGNTELKQCKVVIDIKTDNTNDELAAFITYRIRIGLNSYIEKEINNGCENIVIVINDRNGEPIAVWLAYENNGEIEHDMDVVNTDVLKSVDNVIQNHDIWELAQNEPIDPKDATSESVKSNTTTETSSPVYDDEYLSLKYVGIGIGASYPFRDKQCVIFEVDNKTETTFEFSSISLALDGQDIGYALCYSKITPKSKGKIYVIADEQSNIIGKHPKEISGSMAVKDFLDMDVFGEDEWWHMISFSEIAL